MLRVVFIITFGFAWVACGDDTGESIETQCGLTHSGADIEGRWSLDAKGERTACSDTKLLGELSIRSAEPIVVTGMNVDEDAGTDVTESDAFVNRIVVRTGFDLMGESLPAKLMFDGNTDGSCVSFKLVEDLGGGDELVYDFEGYIPEPGRIEGNFTGLGPDDCETRGTFTIDVR